MPVNKEKNYKIIRLCFGLFLILFYFFALSLNFSQAADATCDSLYPDGKCVPGTTCPTGTFPDKNTALCGSSSGNICCHATAAQPNIQLQVPIFQYTSATNIAEYITKVYEYFLYILTPIAIVIMIWAGMKWILAGGDPPKIQEAKKYISSAFAGLTIAILSYFVLSFLGLTSLELPGIQYIPEERIGGDIEVVGGVPKKAPKTIKDQFNAMECPNISGGELEFEAYFTVYYKPKYGESAGYQSFWCNIGMQCSCPNDKKGNPPEPPAICTSSATKSWKACDYFLESADYCNKSAMGKPPVANESVAGDTAEDNGKPYNSSHKGCYQKGCKFTIVGDPTNKTYVMTDRGGDIQSRHFDYFAGYGYEMLKKTPVSGKRTIKLDQASCQVPGKVYGNGKPPTSTLLTHAEASQKLASANILISSSGSCSDPNNPNCTSLEGIPASTIEKLIAMKADNKDCAFVITGGTETGHSSHGSGKPIVDLRLADCLIAPLKNRSKYGIVWLGAQKNTPYYNAVSADFNDIGQPHFHVKFSL